MSTQLLVETVITGSICWILIIMSPLAFSSKKYYVLGNVQARGAYPLDKPVTLVEAVARGVDMFDCVLPTRSGRHGQAWTWDGAINLKNAKWVEDDTPIDPSSSCPASRDYSKAYLNHLFKAGEYLGPMLLSWHNIAFFQALTAAMRAAIAEGRFEAFRADFKARQRIR